MSQQQDILQLPRHTQTVKQLADANKIGKTTVVFARSIDGVNTGVEKLNQGFIHFVDKQIKLGPGNLPNLNYSVISIMTKIVTSCKNAISAEFLYLKNDVKTFLKQY